MTHSGSPRVLMIERTVKNTFSLRARVNIAIFAQLYLSKDPRPPYKLAKMLTEAGQVYASRHVGAVLTHVKGVLKDNMVPLGLAAEAGKIPSKSGEQPTYSLTTQGRMVAALLLNGTELRIKEEDEQETVRKYIHSQMSNEVIHDLTYNIMLEMIDGGGYGQIRLFHALHSLTLCESPRSRLNMTYPGNLEFLMWMARPEEKQAYWAAQRKVMKAAHKAIKSRRDQLGQKLRDSGKSTDLTEFLDERS